MVATENKKQPEHDPPQSVDGIVAATDASASQATAAEPTATKPAPEPTAAKPAAEPTATTSTFKRGNPDLLVRFGAATRTKLKAIFQKSDIDAIVSATPNVSAKPTNQSASTPDGAGASTEPSELALTKTAEGATPAKTTRRRDPDSLVRLGEATNTKLKELLQGADLLNVEVSEPEASAPPTSSEASASTAVQEAQETSANPKFRRRRKPDLLVRLGEATNTKLKELLQGSDFFDAILSNSSAAAKPTDRGASTALADSVTTDLANLGKTASKRTNPKPKFTKRGNPDFLMRLGEVTSAKLQALFQHSELLNPVMSGSIELDNQAVEEPQIKKPPPRTPLAVRTAPRDFGNPKSRALLQAPWLLLLLTGLVILSLTKLSTIEIRRAVSSRTQAAMPKKFSGMQFASCDQKNKIKFLSADQCEIDTATGSRRKVKYSLLFGQPDLATFLMGYLRRNELWCHYNADGLVGSDGIALYNPNSPELAIVKKMWWYANFANRYYKESKLYPNDAEKCKHSDPNFLYINPITHLSDYAAIVWQKQINTDLILRASNKQLWRPGAILCLGFERKKFFIQGCDGDGKPLTSAVPGQFFTIICENGVNLTEREQSQFLNQLKAVETNSAMRLFLYQTPELDATVQGERLLCQLLLWSAFSLASLWCYAKHRAKSSRQARLASIAVAVFCLLGVAAWYICAFFG